MGNKKVYGNSRRKNIIKVSKFVKSFTSTNKLNSNVQNNTSRSNTEAWENGKNKDVDLLLKLGILKKSTNSLIARSTVIGRKRNKENIYNHNIEVGNIKFNGSKAKTERNQKGYYKVNERTDTWADRLMLFNPCSPSKLDSHRYVKKGISKNNSILSDITFKTLNLGNKINFNQIFNGTYSTENHKDNVIDEENIQFEELLHKMDNLLLESKINLPPMIPTENITNECVLTSKTGITYSEGVESDDENNFVIDEGEDAPIMNFQHQKEETYQTRSEKLIDEGNILPVETKIDMRKDDEQSAVIDGAKSILELSRSRLESKFESRNSNFPKITNETSSKKIKVDHPAKKYILCGRNNTFIEKFIVENEDAYINSTKIADKPARFLSDKNINSTTYSKAEEEDTSMMNVPHQKEVMDLRPKKKGSNQNKSTKLTKESNIFPLDPDLDFAVEMTIDCENNNEENEEIDVPKSVNKLSRSCLESKKNNNETSKKFKVNPPSKNYIFCQKNNIYIEKFILENEDDYIKSMKTADKPASFLADEIVNSTTYSKENNLIIAEEEDTSIMTVQHKKKVMDLRPKKKGSNQNRSTKLSKKSNILPLDPDLDFAVEMTIDFENKSEENENIDVPKLVNELSRSCLESKILIVPENNNETSKKPKVNPPSKNYIFCQKNNKYIEKCVLENEDADRKSTKIADKPASFQADEFANSTTYSKEVKSDKENNLLIAEEGNTSSMNVQHQKKVMNLRPKKKGSNQNRSTKLTKERNILPLDPDLDFAVEMTIDFENNSEENEDIDLPLSRSCLKSKVDSKNLIVPENNNETSKKFKVNPPSKNYILNQKNNIYIEKCILENEDADRKSTKIADKPASFLAEIANSTTYSEEVKSDEENNLIIAEEGDTSMLNVQYQKIVMDLRPEKKGRNKDRSSKLTKESNILPLDPDLDFAVEMTIDFENNSEENENIDVPKSVNELSRSCLKSKVDSKNLIVPEISNGTSKKPKVNPPSKNYMFCHKNNTHIEKFILKNEDAFIKSTKTADKPVRFLSDEIANSTTYSKEVKSDKENKLIIADDGDTSMTNVQYQKKVMDLRPEKKGRNKNRSTKLSKKSNILPLDPDLDFAVEMTIDFENNSEENEDIDLPLSRSCLKSKVDSKNLIVPEISNRTSKKPKVNPPSKINMFCQKNNTHIEKFILENEAAYIKSTKTADKPARFLGDQTVYSTYPKKVEYDKENNLIIDKEKVTKMINLQHQKKVMDLHPQKKRRYQTRSKKLTKERNILPMNNAVLDLAYVENNKDADVLKPIIELSCSGLESKLESINEITNETSSKKLKVTRSRKKINLFGENDGKIKKLIFENEDIHIKSQQKKRSNNRKRTPKRTYSKTQISSASVLENNYHPNAMLEIDPSGKAAIKLIDDFPLTPILMTNDNEREINFADSNLNSSKHEKPISREKKPSLKRKPRPHVARKSKIKSASSSTKTIEQNIDLPDVANKITSTESGLFQQNKRCKKGELNEFHVAEPRKLTEKLRNKRKFDDIHSTDIPSDIKIAENVVYNSSIKRKWEQSKGAIDRVIVQTMTIHNKEIFASDDENLAKLRDYLELQLDSFESLDSEDSSNYARCTKIIIPGLEEINIFTYRLMLALAIVDTAKDSLCKMLNLKNGDDLKFLASMTTQEMTVKEPQLLCLKLFLKGKVDPNDTMEVVLLLPVEESLNGGQCILYFCKIIPVDLSKRAMNKERKVEFKAIDSVSENETSWLNAVINQDQDGWHRIETVDISQDVHGLAILKRFGETRIIENDPLLYVDNAESITSGNKTHTEKPPYSCFYCQFTSYVFQIMEDHTIKNHFNSSAVMCGVCKSNTSPNEKPTARSLCQVHSAIKSWPQQLRPDSSVANQRKRNKEKIVYACDKCNFRGKNAKELSRHENITGHFQGDVTKCSSCYFRGTERQVKRHYSAKHRVANFNCMFCKNLFVSPQTLDRHVSRKHPEQLSCKPVSRTSVIKGSTVC